MKDTTQPYGPGWFDSSLDLRSGLDVVEAEHVDLDLPSWIELFLAAQPRPVRVASPSAITAIA